MALFSAILQENLSYKSKQREIEKLEAGISGQVLPEPEPPELAAENIEPSGTFGIYFNADLAGLAFLETLNKGLASRGQNENPGRRRLPKNSRRYLDTTDTFSMDQFIKFEIQRGSEDAADIEDLGFQIKAAGLENNLLKFQLEFDHPLQVSIGTIKDSLVTTIVDGSWLGATHLPRWLAPPENSKHSSRWA